MDIPSPVRAIIFNWMNEFHRIDMMERVTAVRRHFANEIRTLCADIRANPPVYTYTYMLDLPYRVNVTLPACNPATDRIWQRRALSVFRTRPHT